MGKTNKQKVKEAEELKAKEAEELKAKEAEIKADEDVINKAASEKKLEYRVCKGKSIMCKKGIINGDAIKAKDRIVKLKYVDGQKALDALVKQGYVEKF